MVQRYTNQISNTAFFGVAALLLLFALLLLNLKFHWNSTFVDQYLASDTILSNQQTILLVTGLILISVASITVGFRRSMNEKNEMVQRRVLCTQNEVDAYLEILNAHSIVTVSDVNNVIVEVNENFLKTLGYELDEALGQNRMIMLVSQKDVDKEEPEQEDLYAVGTVAVIMRMLKLPDGRIRILIQGLSRARVDSISAKGDYVKADITPIAEPLAPTNSLEVEALVRNVRGSMERASNLGKTSRPKFWRLSQIWTKPAD